MQNGTQIMDDAQIRRSMTRMAHEVIERNKGLDNVVLVGILTRGIVLAQRIASKLEEIEGQKVACYSLDATPFRDDLKDHPKSPSGQANSELNVAGKHVVLVDDVLYTGRTVRAALEAMMHAGRPLSVQLATLVDRGHRELPIRPDYIGKNLPTARHEEVIVRFTETDEEDGVWISDALHAH